MQWAQRREQGGAESALGSVWRTAELDDRGVDRVQGGNVVVAHAQLVELLLRVLLALGRRVVAVHHALVPQRRVVLEVHRARVQARRVELLVAQGGLVELAQLLVAQVEDLVRGKGRLRLRLGLRLGLGQAKGLCGGRAGAPGGTPR